MSWLNKLTEKADKLSWAPLPTDGYVAAIAGRFTFVVKEDTTKLTDLDGTLLDEYETPDSLWSKVLKHNEARSRALVSVMEYLDRL